MTCAQTIRAIVHLEAQGHQFKLLADGKLCVTNVTPQLQAFITRFIDNIKQALAHRQMTAKAVTTFPGGTIESSRTWPEILQKWRNLSQMWSLEQKLCTLSGCIASLQGDKLAREYAIQMFETEAGLTGSRQISLF